MIDLRCERTGLGARNLDSAGSGWGKAAVDYLMNFWVLQNVGLSFSYVSF